MQLAVLPRTRRLALACAVVGGEPGGRRLQRRQQRRTGPAPDVQPGPAAGKPARERGAALQARPPHPRLDRAGPGRHPGGPAGRRLHHHRRGPRSGVHPRHRAGADSRRAGGRHRARTPRPPRGSPTTLSARLGGPQAAGRRGGPRADRGLRQRAGRRGPRDARSSPPTTSRSTPPASPARSRTSRRRTDARRARPIRRAAGAAPSKGARMQQRRWYAARRLRRGDGRARRPRAAARRAERQRRAARRRAARIRDLDIDFYQARVARDPRSARDFTQLAGLYLQRARETADNARPGAGRGDRAAFARAPARPQRAPRSACSRRASWGSTGSPRRTTSAERLLRGGLHFGRRARAGGETAWSWATTTRPPGCSASLATYQATSGWRPGWRAGPSCAGSPRRRDACCAQALDDAAGATGCRASSSPGSISGWATWRFGPGTWRRRATSSTPGSRSVPGDYRLLGAWPGSRRSAARLARAPRTTASRPSPGPLDPATLGLLTTPTPRSATPPRPTSTTAPWRSRCCASRGRSTGPGASSCSTTAATCPRVLAEGGGRARTRRDIYGYDLLAWALHRSGPRRRGPGRWRRRSRSAPRTRCSTTMPA